MVSHWGSCTSVTASSSFLFPFPHDLVPEEVVIWPLWALIRDLDVRLTWLHPASARKLQLVSGWWWLTCSEDMCFSVYVGQNVDFSSCVLFFFWISFSKDSKLSKSNLMRLGCSVRVLLMFWGLSNWLYTSPNCRMTGVGVAPSWAVWEHPSRIHWRSEVWQLSKQANSVSHFLFAVRLMVPKHPPPQPPSGNEQCLWERWAAGLNSIGENSSVTLHLWAEPLR